MKQTLFSQIFILFFIAQLIILASCDSTQLSGIAPSTKAQSQVIQNCYNNCLPDTIPYKITSNCGECMISKFKTNGISVFSSKKIKGFKIEQQELTQILSEIETNKNIELYAMLALRNSDANNEDYEPELVFQLQEKNQDGIVIENLYYDFTKPCPNACPDTSHQVAIIER